MFTEQVSDKGFVFRMNTNSYSVTGGKLIRFFKWEESPERHFTKADIWMAKKQMKMLNIINC